MTETQVLSAIIGGLIGWALFAIAQVLWGVVSDVLDARRYYRQRSGELELRRIEAEFREEKFQERLASGRNSWDTFNGEYIS